MANKCPFCNEEHDDLLDSLTEETSKMAKEFTERVFPKIWGKGGGSKIAMPMDKEEVARMMFYTGATQMLVDYLLKKSTI